MTIQDNSDTIKTTSSYLVLTFKQRTFVYENEKERRKKPQQQQQQQQLRN